MTALAHASSLSDLNGIGVLHASQFHKAGVRAGLFRLALHVANCIAIACAGRAAVRSVVSFSRVRVREVLAHRPWRCACRGARGPCGGA